MPIFRCFLYLNTTALFGMAVCQALIADWTLRSQRGIGPEERMFLFLFFKSFFYVSYVSSSLFIACFNFQINMLPICSSCSLLLSSYLRAPSFLLYDDCFVVLPDLWAVVVMLPSRILWNTQMEDCSCASCGNSYRSESIF